MTIRKTLLTASAALTLLAPATFAQTRHLNPVQKHPTMTGVAAGAATHHALKVSARHKKARGQHLNFAERHPTLTGIAAAVGTRHAIKKHTPHH